jgi:micrococcal nuclease
VLSLVVLSGCTASPSARQAATTSGSAAEGAASDVPGDRQSGRVFHVVDGDTVDVTGMGRIRVIGIDTPERGECGYESATLAMAALVQGRVVTLVAGAQDDADRYGRLLRYVDVGSTDSGLALIEQGWAIARYDSRDGYGHHAREEQYAAADAVSEDLGCYPD